MTALSSKSSDSMAVPEIFGYQFVRRIGFGGMGDAVLARQLSLDRQVAIKILKPLPEVMEAEQTLRFEREALMMANLAHPNVVRVYDRGIVEGRPYLVMEYVEGGDLRQRMTSEQPMPLDETRSVLRDVCTALEFLHAEGILHRDLKPENILIDDQGVAKVADFGIAVPLAETGQVTRTGQIMGTLDYIAPEQRYNHPIDERADQYSLGVLAYELLTGHKPVGVFPAVSKRNPRVGVLVDRVLSRALQQDPDERYETLGQFASELDAAIESIGKAKLKWVPAVATIVLVGVVIGASVLVVGRGETDSLPAGTGAQAGTGPETGTGSETRIGTGVGGVVVPAELLAEVPFGVERAASVQALWAARLGRDVTEENSLQMTLCLVPAGGFPMGSSSELIASLVAESKQRQDKDYAQGRLHSEMPRHPVQLTRPFDISAMEVTVAQFRQFIESSGYRTDIERNGQGYGRLDSKWQRDPRFNWANLGSVVLDESWPVVNISYYDAQTFCRWLSEREGERYRLPSEAEWEFACRAGSSAAWLCGDDAAELTEYAVYGPGTMSMTVVGTMRPNAFGLFDTSGNVWEWCLDWYSTDYYARSPTANPSGPRQGELRVVRGGSFVNLPSLQRCATRQGQLPDRGRQSIGFRVVREIAIGDSGGDS